jgi:hypothetical protein
MAFTDIQSHMTLLFYKYVQRLFNNLEDTTRETFHGTSVIISSDAVAKCESFIQNQGIRI